MKCWNDDNFLNTAPGIKGGDFVFKLSYSGTIPTAMAAVAAGNVSWMRIGECNGVFILINNDA